MAKKKKIYSYIRYPFSRGGWVSLILGAVSLILTEFTVYETISRAGEISMFIGAVGFSAILFDIVAILFAAASLREKEKNYLMTIIGALIAFAVLIEWVLILAG